jgi:hypothetical protein
MALGVNATLSDKESAEAHVAPATPVRNGTAVRHKMGFHSGIERKAPGLLNVTDTWMIEDFKNRQQLQATSLTKLMRLHRRGSFVIEPEFERCVHLVVLGFRQYF